MIYKYTIWCADVRKNKFMEALDLKHDGKWFVYFVELESTALPTEEKFMGMINESYDKRVELGDWIPAITFQDNMFCHESVTELSNGKHLWFPKH